MNDRDTLRSNLAELKRERHRLALALQLVQDEIVRTNYLLLMALEAFVSGNVAARGNHILNGDPTHAQCDERQDCYHRCVVYDLPPLELFYGPPNSDTGN